MSNTVSFDTDTLDFQNAGNTTLKITAAPSSVDFEGVAGVDVELTGVNRIEANDPGATVDLWTTSTGDINFGTSALGTITIGNPLGSIDLQGAIISNIADIQQINRPSDGVAASLWIDGTGDVNLGTAATNTTVGGSILGTTTSIPAATVQFSGAQTGINTQTINIPVDGNTPSLWPDATTNVSIASGALGVVSIGNAGGTVSFPSTSTVSFSGSQTGVNTQSISRPTDGGLASLWTDGTGDAQIATSAATTTVGGSAASTVLSLPAETVQFSGLQTGINTESITIPINTNTPSLWTDAQADIDIGTGALGTITIGNVAGEVTFPGTVNLEDTNVQDITRPDPSTASTLWVGNGSITIGSAGTASVSIPTTNALVLSGSQTGVNTQTINRPDDGTLASLWADGTGNVGIATAALNITLGTPAATSILNLPAETINLSGEITGASMQDIGRPDPAQPANLWTTGTGAVNVGTSATTTTLGGSGIGSTSNVPAATIAFSGLQTGVNTQQILLPDNNATANLWTDAQVAVNIATTTPGLITIGASGDVDIAPSSNGTITIGDVSSTLVAGDEIQVQNVDRLDGNVTSNLVATGTAAVNIATSSNTLTLGATGVGKTVNIPAATVAFSGAQTGVNTLSIAHPDDTSAANLWTDTAGVVNIATATTANINIGAVTGTVVLPGTAEIEEVVTDTVFASAPTADISAWDNTTANISIGDEADIIGIGESVTTIIAIGTAAPTITVGTGGTTVINIGSGGITNLSISAVTDFNTFESVNFVTEDIDRVAGANAVSLWSDAGTGAVTIGSTGALTNTSIPAATVAFTGVQTGLNAQSIALPEDTDPATLWADSDGLITIGSNTSTVSIPGTFSPGSLSSQDITRPNTGFNSVLWAGNGPIELGDTGTTNLVIPNTFTAHNTSTVTGWGNVTTSANLFGSATGNITLGSATTASVRMQNINRVGTGSNSALWPTGTGDVSVGSSSAALNLNGNVVSANAPVINLGDETTITSAQILERPDNTILGTIWDTGTGNISIGAAAGTIAIGSSGGITTVGNASSGELRSQVINAFNPASDSVLFSTNNTTDIRIGEGLGTGKIELGRANVTFGGVAIQKQIAHDASSTVSLYDDVTAASTAFGGLTGNNLTIGGALGTGTIRLGTAAGTGGTLVQKISAIDPNTASSLFTNAISAVTLGPTGGATTVNIPANTVAFSGSQTGLNAQNIALPTDISAANLWTDASDVVNIATGTTQPISIGAAGGTVNLAGNTGKAVVQNIERPDDLETSSLWTDGTAAITIGNAGGTVSLPGTVSLGSFSSQSLSRPTPGSASTLWAGTGLINIGDNTTTTVTLPNTINGQVATAVTGWANVTGASALFGNASLTSLIIGGGMPSGALQLGQGTGSTVTVNLQRISAISPTVAATMFTNLSGAGSLTLGSTATSTTIDATVLTIANTTNAKTNNATVNLFTNLIPSGSLIVGSDLTPTTIEATTLTLANTIAAKSVTGGHTFWGNIANSTVALFGNSGLTALNIANAATAAAISIGGALATTSLQLGSTAFNATSGVLIQKTRAIVSSTAASLWDDVTATSSMFAGLTTNNLTIASGITTGTVQIGNSAALSIQSIGSSNVIQMGNAANIDCTYKLLGGAITNRNGIYTSLRETSATAVTYTAAQLRRGLILRSGAWTGDLVSDTMPGAVVLTNAFACQQGDYFDVVFKNETSIGTLEIKGVPSEVQFLDSIGAPVAGTPGRVRIGPLGSKTYRFICDTPSVNFRVIQISAKSFATLTGRVGGGNGTARLYFTGPYVSLNATANLVGLNGTVNATFDHICLGRGGTVRRQFLTISSSGGVTGGTIDINAGVLNVAQNAITSFATLTAALPGAGTKVFGGAALAALDSAILTPTSFIGASIVAAGLITTGMDIQYVISIEMD